MDDNAIYFPNPDNFVGLLPRDPAKMKQLGPAEYTALTEIKLQMKRAGILFAKKRRFEEKTGEFAPGRQSTRGSDPEQEPARHSGRRVKKGGRNGLKR